MTLWFLGYPDQALQRIHQAMTLAKELAHPYTLALVHNRAAFLGQFLRQRQATREWAEVAMVTAAEHGFPRHAALGPILRGWAVAMQAQGEEGIAQIRQGLVAYRGLGMAMEAPYFLALLAEAHASVGLIDEGLAALAEALAALPSGRDFFYKAELYRLRGEFLWHQSNADDGQVAACFQQALEIARRQYAQSLALRAALSLSRLWQRQGKRDEARRLLAEIYNQFTEGFATPDLQDAKTLLAELA